ncbi:MAG: tryptophan-rich sensory protein [Clostridia bacterium]|nr:tryptophan-rich sensory protein [Clostridia bacterium]
MRQDTARNLKIFAIAIAIPLAIGGLSALLTRGNMQIYSEVRTPPLSLPAILFPIVWTLLYILMGVSSAIIWANREKDIEAAQSGLAAYAVSLAFNFTWSILFFNFRLFGFSFVWLIALWILILVTILQYRKISPTAAYLQIPYAVWVAFAGYLNAGIWWLNR